MKKVNFKKLLVFVIAILFAASLFIPKEYALAARTSAEIQKEIDQLEDKQKSNTAKLKQIQDNINSTGSSLKQAMNSKALVEDKLSVCQQNIENTEKIISDYETLISIKETEISEKEKQINDEYDRFREWLRLSYEYGAVSYVQMFISSESLTDFLLNAELVGNMLSYESDKLDGLDEDLAELNEDYASLSAYKATLDEKKAELDAQKKEYDETVSSYDESIKALQANQTVLSSQYAQMKAADDELDKTLTKLLSELAAAKKNEYVGGTWRWPVDVQYSRISSYFGWRDLWGTRDYHRGIDIPAPSGSNIYASNAGEVIAAANHYSYGNYIVIDHGGGYSTLYAHSSKLIAKVGDFVQQGDVIALVGTTGNSSGNHVHFEIRIDGVVKDPLGFVAQP